MGIGIDEVVRLAWPATVARIRGKAPHLTSSEQDHIADLAIRTRANSSANVSVSSQMGVLHRRILDRQNQNPFLPGWHALITERRTDRNSERPLLIDALMEAAAELNDQGLASAA